MIHTIRSLVVHSLLFYAVTLHSKIEPIEYIADIWPLINSYDPTTTLIIFDIDNTLITVDNPDDIGSEQWFAGLIEYFKTMNNPDIAMQKAIDHYVAIQPEISYKPVESTTASTIKKIRAAQFPIICLTVRSHSLSKLTIDALSELELHEPTETNGSTAGYLYSRDEHGQSQELPIALLYKDALFTQGNSKGLALAEYIATTSHSIKTVIMVDDKRKHLESVEDACVRMGIDFLGFRYHHLDQRALEFTFLPDIHTLHGELFTKALPEKRQSAFVACHLICRNTRGEILLGLRHNTGYQDGLWGAIAGHAQNGESIYDAIIREAQEEAELSLTQQDLTLKHIIHRRNDLYDRDYIEFFFETTISELPIVGEPHKCAQFNFFSAHQLPQSSQPYLLEAIHAIENNKFFTELYY